MSEHRLREQLEGLPLRQQMLLVFSAVMLLFGLGLGLFVDQQIVVSAVQSRGMQSAQDATFFANLIDADIENHLIDIRVHADDINSVDRPQALRELQSSIQQLQNAKPHFSWIGFAAPSGAVLAATQNMLLGADVSARPWFQQARRGPIVEDVHSAKLLASLLPTIDPTQPLRFIDVAAPARDEQGHVIGILGGHLSVEWLTQRLKSFASSRFQAELVKPAVIGRDGQIRFGHAEAVAGLDTSALWTAAAAHGHGWLVLTPAGGAPAVYGFSMHRGPLALHNVQWLSVLPVTVSAIKTEQAYTRSVAGLGVALVCAAAWLTLYLLLGLASRPIRQLMQQVRLAHESNELLPPLDGLPKEFSEVQATVNNFVGSLRAREEDLKRALEELRESFTGVSQTFPGVLFRLEAQPEGLAEFTYLSPSAFQYLNVDSKTMPLPVRCLFGRHDVQAACDVIEELTTQIAAVQSLDIGFTVEGLDGARRHMQIKGHLRGTGRGRRIWQGVIFDVSDLFIAQRAAAEADQAKSRFLATMSHEIRTPLNGILGFAQLLHQEIHDPAQRADVRKIIDTAEVLTRILNDILDFSRMAEGKLMLELRPFMLEELVTSSTSLFEVEAERRGLAFVVKLQAQAGTRVLGDPTRLQQVLNNLLSNAMKFTLQGQVSLDMSCTRHEEHALLRLTVSDSGIGMSADSLSKLFERFEQTDASVFRRFGGSGLGLAIVKGLIDSMEGTVSVESRLGQGSMFCVEVPLRLVDLPSKPVSADAESALQPLQVLVVDDVATNRELIGRMLRSAGHAVQEAADGQEAVEKASAHGYDLILMDIDMPVMDGLAATRRIRALAGSSRAAAIIALTGHAFEEDVAKAAASGIDAHLAKPIVFTKLKQKIRAVIDERALQP